MMPLRTTFLAVTALFGAAALPAWAEGKTITMVADQWCPFNCDPESADKPGFFVELTRKALEPHGYKVEYRGVPWARAIEEVRADKYQILIAASHEETPDFQFPEESGISCGFNAFTRPTDTYTWQGVESIKNKRIGGIKDYVYSEEINAYIDATPNAGHKIQIMRGDGALATNIKKLLGNRIDVMFENPSVLKYKFSEMGADLAQLQLSGQPRNAGPVSQEASICYLGFGPTAKNKEAVRLVSEGIKRMEASGELQKLKDAYQIN